MTSTVQDTWEDYQRLSDDVRAEYIDGKIVVSPLPRRSHQQAARRLANRLEQACDEAVEVVMGTAWKPADDEFGPDVLVTPPTDEDLRFTGTPLLAVEVLSSNRVHDLVLKARKYAEAGLPRYWVVDPRDRSVTVFELCDGSFVERQVVSAGEEAALDFGAGTVKLRPAELFG